MEQEINKAVEDGLVIPCGPIQVDWWYQRTMNIEYLSKTGMRTLVLNGHALLFTARDINWENNLVFFGYKVSQKGELYKSKLILADFGVPKKSRDIFASAQLLDMPGSGEFHLYFPTKTFGIEYFTENPRYLKRLLNESRRHEVVGFDLDFDGNYLRELDRLEKIVYKTSPDIFWESVAADFHYSSRRCFTGIDDNILNELNRYLIEGNILYNSPSAELPSVELLDIPVGEVIKKWREHKSLNLTELAALSGMAKGYLSQIEHGKINMPNTAVLRRISAALGISPWDIIHRVDPENK